MSARSDLMGVDSELVFLDPASTFDGAILGLAEGCGRPDVVLYSRKKIIEALERSGMEPEDAAEHYEFSIAGAYVGPKTPMFLDD